MTQDERWQRQYEQMMAFMEENHRRPSNLCLEGLRYAQLVQSHEETDSKEQMSSRAAREVRPSDGGC